MRLRRSLLLGAITALGLSGQAIAATTLIQPASSYVSSQPTVTTSAYSTNQSLGGLQTKSLGAYVTRITSYGLVSKSGIVAPIGICFFSANPTGSTFTDHGTFSIAAADLPKLMNPGCLNLAATYTMAGSTATGNVSPLVLSVPKGGVVYEADYVGSTALTPATTTEFVETIGVE